MAPHSAPLGYETLHSAPRVEGHVFTARVAWARRGCTQVDAPVGLLHLLPHRDGEAARHALARCHQSDGRCDVRALCALTPPAPAPHTAASSGEDDARPIRTIVL
eukprot:5955565-Prymnesium_polylepis.1